MTHIKIQHNQKPVEQTFNVVSEAGTVLTSITFYNYGVATAHNGAGKVAKLLAEDGLFPEGSWAIKRLEKTGDAA